MAACVGIDLVGDVAEDVCLSRRKGECWQKQRESNESQ